MLFRSTDLHRIPLSSLSVSLLSHVRKAHSKSQEPRFLQENLLSVVEESAPRPALKRQAQQQKPAEAGCGGLGAAVHIGEGCFSTLGLLSLDVHVQATRQQH